MENASKALIMAGSTLISIVIIALGVYLIQSNGNFSQKYNETLSAEELQAYNAQFEKYVRNGIDNSYDIASDIVSVINKAYDINQRGDPSDFITVTIKLEDGVCKFDNATEAGFIGKKGISNITINEFMEKYSATYVDDKTNSIEYLYKFKCNVDYAKNGKVNVVNFELYK